MLVGTLNAPITNLVGVLSGNTRKLVYALSQIRDKKA
jgi:ribosomal protein L10